MIGATVIKLIQQANYMKSVMKKYKNYMRPGHYRLHESFRAISLDDSEVQTKAKKYLYPMEDYSPRKVQASEFLNKICYIFNRSHTSQGQYQAIYVANNYDKIRETKLFSFDEKNILTICTSAEDMYRQLQEYTKFGWAYTMPQIKQSEKTENALEVSMIDRLDFPGDHFALSAIAEATVAYNHQPVELSYKSVKELVSCSYEDEKIKLLMAELVDCLDDDVLDCKLPLCMQHGDLSKDNLIYGECNQKKAFWWIDWEHTKDRVFFYDYFFYILNSMRYGDMGAYSCYINGQNDDVLGGFFSHFGLVFDPRKKQDYFIIYAICFLKERVCAKGYVHALEQYIDLIKMQLQ